MSNPNIEEIANKVIDEIEEDILAGNNEGSKESGDAIRKRLKKEYRDPPREAFEFLCRKNFSEEEARYLVFKPTEEHARLYPILCCAPPDDCPKDHPQHKVHIPCLAMLFLLC